MPTTDLLSWQVTNPSNLEDYLPQPYRLINQVLNQTIIHQLQLAMHHIEQKKKNPNYQGRVQEYVAQSLIQIDHQIACLSSQPKYQNYLLAGDRKGNALVIDVAKKSLFVKKELTPGKRINFITQTTISDGETFITVAAIISNHSPTIKILRSKHSDPKLFIVAEVQVAENQSDISKLPYECKLQDDARLLIVKTYDGSILGFCLPELKIDEQKIKAQQNINQSISNASNSIKKPLIYPLQSCVLDNNPLKISQKVFQITFQGYEKPLKYKDLLTRLKNKTKAPQPEPQQQNKKDSKKQAKKPEAQNSQAPKQPQKQIIFNEKPQKRETQLWNNNDITEPYQKPKFSPFCYVLYEDVDFPRKKSFEKSKNIKMATKFIYGWTNTKEVYLVNLLTQKAPKYQHTPYYLQFLHNQALMSPQFVTKLQQQYKKSFNTLLISQKASHLCTKTVYPISASTLSYPNQTHLALGLEDGTNSIYLTQNLTLQQNTQKHTSRVTQAQFFENSWKLISGSESGEIFITNLLEQKPQMKKTQVFEGKQGLRIVDIKVNQEVGVAFVIDAACSVRIYDLWRNEKISRFIPCNGFSISEGKGKKWMTAGGNIPTSTIYTNKDYSVFLSIDWPNIPTSKTVEVPQQTLNKVAELKSNPWKSPQIHLHVIRNFEFLLQHFDGLQSVYKKGYEKPKILNLFTNLEFAQLYDRNFDIPDFGRTVNINGPNHNGSTLKSNLSQNSKFNTSKISSHKKSPSKQKTISGKSSAKDTPSGQTRNVKLTTQVLHPEKFLFERRKIFDPVKQLPTTNEKLIEKLRQEHKKKERRANILQQELNKTSGGI